MSEAVLGDGSDRSDLRSLPSQVTADDEPSASQKTCSHTPAKPIPYKLGRRPSANSVKIIGGAVILSMVVIAALGAPLLAPHDPNAQDLLRTLEPSVWSGGSAEFILGTDSLGRCVLSRVIYGARVALLIGTIAPVGALVLGTVIAVLAGYFGRTIDMIVSRAVDVWMSFPPIIMALILMISLKPGFKNVILAIVIVDWTRFCRLVRGETLTLMKRDYVPAARIAGARHLRVIIFELLPGLFPLLVTLLTIEIGIAIIIESVLSFVGYSMAPEISTWGVMVADGLGTMYQQPVALITPMIAIVLTVLGANLLGEGLRKALDPRLIIREGLT
jgi:peptide/nickel transport system permease protein